MQRIKRLLLSSVALLALSFGVLALPAQSVGAVDVFTVCTGNAKETAVCKEKASGNGNPITKTISVAVVIVSVAVGAAAVVVIILSSFKMIRSNGNSSEIAGAKNGIIYSLIGLVIAVLAPVVVGFILNRI